MFFQINDHPFSDINHPNKHAINNIPNINSNMIKNFHHRQAYINQYLNIQNNKKQNIIVPPIISKLKRP